MRLTDVAPRPPRSGGIQFWRDGQEVFDKAQWTLTGNVFCDGSCAQRCDTDVNRAAWGAVEINPGGSVAALRSTANWLGDKTVIQPFSESGRAFAAAHMDTRRERDS